MVNEYFSISCWFFHRKGNGVSRGLQSWENWEMFDNAVFEYIYDTGQYEESARVGPGRSYSDQVCAYLS